MKTKLFFLLSFLFLSKLNAQNIQFPDPNFKSKLLQANAGNQIARNLMGNYFKIDSNNDGEIQTSEAEQVSSLDVDNSNISDLNGIRSFINIQTLLCDLNRLTSLHVGGLTKLVTLFCGSNQIANINLQGAISLVHLQCAQNQLTTLDLTNNINLRILTCSNNKLQSLLIKNGSNELVSFENNPNLVFICCDESQRTEIQQKVNQYGYTNCNVDSVCTSLSTQILLKSSNTVFPNPTKNILNFSTNEKIEKIELYDVIGRLVKTFSNVKDKNINIDNIKKGTYFIKIYTKEQTKTQKIIKE